MIGCWLLSNTPEPSVLWLKAVRSLVRLNAAAGAAAAILTRMMVRVLGP